MTLAKRLGMKTRDERDAEDRARADILLEEIRASDETISIFGREHKCIDATNITRWSYAFTGSGVVWYGGQLIERFDNEEVE